ncbi:MAG: CRISPR-associated endonuclease Cas1 [Cyanobacterium sp.]
MSATDIINEFLDFKNFENAWQKVAKNKGCAGIDGQTISKFASQQETNLQQLRDEVANNDYKPQPYQQVLIPKNQDSWRELRIPTVRDRVVQQALLNVLSPIIEKDFSDCSFAYRPNISYLDAVKQVAHWRDLGYQWVLNADIVKYFDNIDHQILLTLIRNWIDIPGILCLIKAWLSVGCVTKKGLVINEKGVSQGAVISPLLANVYLNEFDRVISASDVKLIRYADDFIVLSLSRERVMASFSEVVQNLDLLGLKLHATKTQVTNFDVGFRFLGHGFLGEAIFPLDSVKEKKKKIQSGENEDTNFSDLSLLSGMPEYEDNLLINEPKNSLKFTQNHSQKRNIWNREMASLYLLEQGTSVFKEYFRFVIYLDKTPSMEIPIREIERIIVFGNIQLTTQVIHACLAHNIPIIYANQRGLYRGHLWNEDSVNLSLQLLQIERHKCLSFQFDFAREVVAGKLKNSKQLLLRFNRKQKKSVVQEAIAGINSDLKSLYLVDNIDQLRGYEGIGTSRYFSGLGELITNENFTFNLRNRQPPKDPVNSLLSFGYTLLFNNVLCLIIAEGLSPYFGNLHYGERKKPYLAFDLMEEFRSVIVDSIVLKMINKGMFNPDDFEFQSDNEGVYLSAPKRKVFLNHFENRMNELVSDDRVRSRSGAVRSPISYRQIIQLQIRSYKHSLLEKEKYKSFERI